MTALTLPPETLLHHVPPVDEFPIEIGQAPPDMAWPSDLDRRWKMRPGNECELPAWSTCATKKTTKHIDRRLAYLEFLTGPKGFVQRAIDIALADQKKGFDQKLARLGKQKDQAAIGGIVEDAAAYPAWVKPVIYLAAGFAMGYMTHKLVQP